MITLKIDPVGIALLGGAVEQRQRLFIEYRGGVFVGQALDEDVGIEAGVADQRHDRAGLRIEHDRAPGDIADRGIDLFLEFDIDRQDHVFGLDRVLLGDHRLLGARVAGDDGEPAARLAGEQIVGSGFDPSATDQLARDQAGIGIGFDILGVDGGDIAGDMRGYRAIGVDAGFDLPHRHAVELGDAVEHFVGERIGKLGDRHEPGRFAIRIAVLDVFGLHTDEFGQRSDLGSLHW